MALVFNLPSVEQVEVAVVPISVLLDPFATVEDDVVFAPGQTEALPMLVRPLRRTWASRRVMACASARYGGPNLARPPLIPYCGAP